MKKYIIFIFIICLGFISCDIDKNQGEKANTEIANTNSNNEDYEVTKLFTTDGITVYRFYDHGYYRYFTNQGQFLDNTSEIHERNDDQIEVLNSTMQ